MNAVDLLKERRSVRRFKDEKVSHDVLKEVVEIARYAPSWANYQVARYTFVDSEEKIKQLASEAMSNFSYNMRTLENAKGVLILSYVNGKSGKLDTGKGELTTTNQNVWEVFDAGIACQTFCLAAHEKGIGTCIFGVFDKDKVPQIVNLPQDESVAALIVYGYPDGDIPKTPRKEVSELVRFAD